MDNQVKEVHDPADKKAHKRPEPARGREHERRSGTGREETQKKGGAGKANWGNELEVCEGEEGTGARMYELCMLCLFAAGGSFLVFSWWNAGPFPSPPLSHLPPTPSISHLPPPLLFTHTYKQDVDEIVREVHEDLANQK